MPPPLVAVVALGLSASLSWGISDFLGGLTSRRAPLLPVLVFSQLIGVLIALPMASLRAEAFPSGLDIVWSLASGFLAAVGIGCLYHGLAVGRMGVVAPMCGILMTGIPVIYGIVADGAPPAAVLVGIFLAIASIALVSRVQEEQPARSSGFGWGLAAGLSLGIFTITISGVSQGIVFGPLAIVRLTEAAVCVIATAAARRPWRISRELWPAVLGIGLLDMTGTAAYIAAVHVGPLAVAAVLSGLYPAATVILAAAVLRERLSRLHSMGLATAALAVILIAGGQRN